MMASEEQHTESAGRASGGCERRLVIYPDAVADLPLRYYGNIGYYAAMAVCGHATLGTDALYDNETSVKDLPLRSAERVKGDSMGGEVGSLGYMSSNQTYEEQKNAGLGGVIRYNLGIYYAITPLDDGTY